MASGKSKMRQLVDWRAAIRAGVISGIIFPGIDIEAAIQEIFAGSVPAGLIP